MGAAPKDVLVVDDNRDIRTMLALRLGLDDRFGHVHEAASGEAAIAQAEAHREVTAVVLDQEMPNGSGIEALPRLRALLPRATIVMYTSDETVHDEALVLGADATVVKPATLERLLDLLAAPHRS